MTRREFIRKAFGLGALGAVGGATGALTMAKLSAEAPSRQGYAEAALQDVTDVVQAAYPRRAMQHYYEDLAMDYRDVAANAIVREGDCVRAWKQALDRVCRFVVAHGGELRELELIKLLPPVRSPWDRELREFVFVTARHRTPLLP